MILDDDTRRAIERKARLFDMAKERAVTRIIDNVRIATEKLKAAEKELLEEAEVEFCVNPFAALINSVDSGRAPTSDKVRAVLAQDVPMSFGPDEESFRALLREIDRFKTWEKKKNGNNNSRNLLDLVPKNIKLTEVTWDSISLSWDGAGWDCFYEVEIKSLFAVKNVYNTPNPSYVLSGLKPKTEYYVRVRTVALESEGKRVWSNPIRVQTKGRVLDDGWRRCSEYVDEERKYVVDVENPRIATKTGGDNGCCSIVGKTSLPLNKVISWHIKVLKSKSNDGKDIYIGVAPSDINQNEDYNWNECGWYFDCHESTLYSGPPHNFCSKEYGPRKGNGQYVHTGDSVGVVMDTAKGELSFVLNGVNCGVAYEGIPLDKPLLPSVILKNKGDSIELNTSEVKENVDSSNNVSNITAESTTWDSINLTWDVVGGTSFYQIEVDGNKILDESTTNSFTKRGLLPETEHTFRVRAVKGNSMSEWSDIVKGRIQKESFETSGWKECPDDVAGDMKYSIDEENPRIATKIGGGYDYCTIIGNTPLPLNKVTSWSIKILKSYNNNGNNIYIGVAPSDINQNDRHNYNKCGWYFDCYESTLFSGPPHKYRRKDYGLRKEGGQYVHTRDSVGVVMDTTKGKLSFVVNGVNLGVAYEGIPLDKLLVPCVLLYQKGDSVELDTSGVKEAVVDSSIPVPSNITTKRTTWDSIILAWDAVEGGSFYQIEMDGSKFLEISTTNSFTKRGLLPDTEYSFRVRTVKGNFMSEWSDIVKGMTQEESFEGSWWKKCPTDIDWKMKYFVDERNPRIATKIFDSETYSPIIGKTSLPPNKVTSWSIKVLKSKKNNGIFIGVAPSDINQNEDCNFEKCGWYFDCYDSVLYSGPPHNYSYKGYGPRKEEGEYVHTGDSVGVIMDTTKGELSFVVNGVNLGVAFEGIPLDKPLVPCVLFKHEDDSVELDTSEVKETVVDTSIPVPSNIKAKSTTWDSITLTWDYISGRSFYQIEVDGSKSWDLSTTNTFTKRSLLPETEHTFRVRVVKGNSVSEWSGVVKWRSQKESFETSGWKECPDDDWGRKYSVYSRNSKIVMKIGVGWSTIIGNTPLPLNKVTSWNIKMLKSKYNNGGGIYIGIALSDIDLNVSDNFEKCGWYFDYYHLILYSGPPHNYKGKRYRYYIYSKDSVGVVMDTAKGELSFVLNGVNLGVAYEGIPLDKPLVPCVILLYEGDSVELDTAEVKVNVDNSISVPSSITTKSTAWDSITLTWGAVEGKSFYQIEMDGKILCDQSYTNTFTKRGLLPETEHTFRVRTVRGSLVSEWSDVVKGRTQKESFETSRWEECPEYVAGDRKYSIDEENPRGATKIGDNGHCTIIWNAFLPPNQATSWSIKILKSRGNDGNGIHIGVAPSDIDQNEEDNLNKCGWYFDRSYSGLSSGSPHNYKRKKYGQYTHARDNVGVVMDTTNGELSFVVNGVNLGIAYEGIPLDKPLVPCVLLYNKGGSVKLDTSEIKENVDSSVSAPSNVSLKSGTTWDSITLTWDAVEGKSFYQIEVDGSKSWDQSYTNTFTKKGLLPKTEHTFRVRTVKGNSVGGWSDAVKGRIQKESFETSGWKECPDNVVDEDNKYSVDEENPRIARFIGDNLCTIIGNTPLPHNEVTSWRIKVLKSKDNDGSGIYIGVAPPDINQNEDSNPEKCGWYFDCYGSALCSGTPHNYNGKEFDPRKEKKYHYTHTGTSIGVVMDTAKGELSFVLDGVNCGVAYAGIPIDKPLVPCVLLKNNGDSVELDTSEVKENVDSSIPIPSNATAKSFTWNSIIYTWSDVKGASFYQIEVDRSIIWIKPTKCLFTKRELLPDTEHTFRIRTVKWSAVSEWSDIMKVKTPKESIEHSIWKECPSNAKDKLKYVVDEKNPRIATKITEYGCCTVVGNMPLPLNKVTSWNIRILKSVNNNGDNISIGIAQFDIDQCTDENYKKCGWYFVCFDSTLCSGPPHNYRGKEYGSKKENGEYVKDGDSAGVVMNTAKGELSFVVNGVNLGVAYEGIPLDKPLVPCVLLEYKDNSIELII